MIAQPMKSVITPIGRLLGNFLMLSLFFFSIPQMGQGSNGKVLFLGSYHQGDFWEDQILLGIRQTLARNQVDLSVEYLDSRQNPTLDYGEDFARFLSAKYRARGIQLVIAADDAALDFWIERQVSLLPELPVVFCGINNHDEDRLRRLRNATGILETPDIEGTIQLALKIFPATRKLYMVASDRNTMYSGILQDFRKSAKHFENLLTIEEVLNLAFADVPERIKSIPPHSILLLLTALEGAAGQTLTSQQTAALLSMYSQAPIFSYGESEMGWGPIGGLVISGEAHGEAAAQLALRILAGEKADVIPVVRENPTVPVFDYRVLQRFRVRESLLPPGSHLLNRPASLYTHYWKWFWAIGLFFLLETWLVIQLLISRRSRNQTEIGLRESEKRLKSAQAMAHVGNWEIDLGTQKIWGSEEAFRIYGVTAPSGWVPLEMAQTMVDPADRPQLDQSLKRLVAAGEPYEVEFRVQNASDGQWHIIHSRASLICDSEGRPLKVAGVLQDITEQKKAAAALAESEARYRMIAENSTDLISLHTLEGIFLYASPAIRLLYGYAPEEIVGHSAFEFIHPDDKNNVEAHRLETTRQGENKAIQFRVIRKDGGIIWLESISRIMPAAETENESKLLVITRNITDRLQSEEERIQLERRIQHAQKLESLGVLAGGIAHDFNNLLMAILGNLGLAMEDLSPISPARPFVADAERAAHRAADLTRQMLAYSGKGRFLVQAVNLSELVEEMLHLLKSSIAKTVMLNLHLEPGLPKVQADPGQLQQVVMNLIVNASEAIGDQPGTITLVSGLQYCDADYLKRSRLEEKPPAGDYIFLEISDTGCGMDQETQQRLFDPFFTTKFYGRGLGMSAVLGIIRGHQGAILVYSEINKGTTFKILLPTADSAQGAFSSSQEIKIAAPPASPFQGVVLLVDDEAMVRDLGQKMLERLGFQVQTAADGEEACELFRQSPEIFCCVILDLTMPKMDGITTFRELKQINPRVTVLLSSGFNHQDVTQQFAGKGLAGFIQKPYQIKSLRNELQKILRVSPTTPE
jgi:PAS domain S-box-containing protein